MNEQKKVFDQVMQKQLRLFRRVFCLVFGGLCAVFFVLGVVLLLLGVTDVDGFRPGVVFVWLGVVFGAVCLLCHFFLPKRASFEKYQARTQKYGVQSSYDVAVTLQILHHTIKQLEQRIDVLEEQIKQM